jgi:hypothetical protein
MSAVQLIMLAQPAALLLFVTKKLTDGKPLERFFERTLVSGDGARECRRQFGTHRNFAFAFVGEIEKLIDNFGAAFFSIKIGWLKDRSVPFHEPVSPRDVAPAGEDVISRGAIVGQEISETWERLHHFKTDQPTGSEPLVAVE